MRLRASSCWKALGNHCYEDAAEVSAKLAQTTLLNSIDVHLVHTSSYCMEGRTYFIQGRVGVTNATSMVVQSNLESQPLVSLMPDS